MAAKHHGYDLNSWGIRAGDQRETTCASELGSSSPWALPICGSSCRSPFIKRQPTTNSPWNRCVPWRLPVARSEFRTV